jgi:hypothetical protein
MSSTRSSRFRRPTRAVALLALMFSLGVPALAQASEQQISIMQDDDLLLYRGDQVRDSALRRMSSLGVDYVRVTVLWSVVADGARNTKARDRRFRGLKASNPKAYPRANWDRYDRLARACVTLRVGCYFDVTGPGPIWGHQIAPKSQRRNQKTWKPKPKEFYKFVQAVGKRFSGGYRDENDGRVVIPRVSFWSIWNEPNQGGWLTPQWERGRPASPALYRQLYIFGRRALLSTGHAAKDVVLAGETAPLGNPGTGVRSPMTPKLFIRELLCAPGTSGIGCSDFDKYGPLQTTGWAHHPYTKRLAPNARDTNPDSITMANIGELPQLLDQLAATGRIAGNLPVFSTEYGYESNPPDPHSGIPLETQAQWLILGDFLTYKQPRIQGNTQFLLRDVSPVRGHKNGSKAYWFTYQSGLFNRRDQEKPAARAYTFPFLAFGGPRDPATNQLQVGVWGMLRFRPNNVPADFGEKVQIHWRAENSPQWNLVGELPVTGGKGFFEGSVLVPGPGFMRGHWSGQQIPFNLSSREFKVVG